MRSADVSNRSFVECVPGRFLELSDFPSFLWSDIPGYALGPKERDQTQERRGEIWTNAKEKDDIIHRDHAGTQCDLLDSGDVRLLFFYPWKVRLGCDDSIQLNTAGQFQPGGLLFSGDALLCLWLDVGRGILPG